MQLAPDAVLGEIGNQPMIFRIKHWETSPAVWLETQSWILLMVFIGARVEGSNVEQAFAATLIKRRLFLLALVGLSNECWTFLIKAILHATKLLLSRLLSSRDSPDNSEI
jgi:hypothetical protein